MTGVETYSSWSRVRDAVLGDLLPELGGVGLLLEVAVFEEGIDILQAKLTDGRAIQANPAHRYTYSVYSRSHTHMHTHTHAHTHRVTLSQQQISHIHTL